MAITIVDSIPFQFGQFRAHLLSFTITNAGSPHTITNAVLTAAGKQPFGVRSVQALFLINSNSGLSAKLHYTVVAAGSSGAGDLSSVVLTTANAAAAVSILILGY